MKKGKESLDPISMEHIDLLDDWISEEPGVFDGDDLNWETIEAPFASMSLADDEELNYTNDEADIDPSHLANAWDFDVTEFDDTRV